MKLRLLGRWYIVMAPALAILLAACGGGGPATPTPTPTATLTPTPAGFLPTPTPEPTPTKAPGTRSGPLGDCPPQPQVLCTQPGDTSNVYQGASMSRAKHLRAQFYDAAYQWVLEPLRVREILRTLDREVVLEPYTIGGPLTRDRTRFELTVFWPEGAPPFPELPVTSVSFWVDLAAGAMGESTVQVQWPIPSEFGELLFRYLSDVIPTPPLPPPTATPTATIVPPGTVFFVHPEGELRWDGPDDRVYSLPDGHCGGLDPDFGTPALIVLEDDIGFWRYQPVRREAGWHWTGYYYGDWQLWQGDDALVIYLVHSDEERVAFEYQSYPCF